MEELKEKLKAQLKGIYEAQGKETMRLFIGNSISFDEYLKLGNSFIPKKDRWIECLNSKYTGEDFGSVFIANELEKEYTKTIRSVEDLEFKKMLSGEEDQLGAMLEINPGAGGTESQDWADMLNRMYIMWGETNGYSVKQVNSPCYYTVLVLLTFLLKL